MGTTPPSRTQSSCAYSYHGGGGRDFDVCQSCAIHTRTRSTQPPKIQDSIVAPFKDHDSTLNHNEQRKRQRKGRRLFLLVHSRALDIIKILLASRNCLPSPPRLHDAVFPPRSTTLNEAPGHASWCGHHLRPSDSGRRGLRRIAHLAPRRLQAEDVSSRSWAPRSA